MTKCNEGNFNFPRIRKWQAYVKGRKAGAFVWAIFEDDKLVLTYPSGILAWEACEDGQHVRTLIGGRWRR